MEGIKLFFVLGTLAWIALPILHHVIARTILPPSFLEGIQRQRWTALGLAVAVAPGFLAFLVGMAMLQLYFWGPFCLLSLLMLATTAALWAVGKAFPRLTFFQKIGWIFALYWAAAMVLAIPSFPAPHAPQLLLRTLIALLALLVLALSAAGALLVVAAATAYLAVAGEIARAVLLPHLSRFMAATAAPPAAPAAAQPASPPRARPARTRPQEVSLAVSLIYAALALSVPKLLLDLDFLLASGRGFVVLANLIGLGVTVVLAWKISEGRNWARATFVVLLALSALLFLLTGPRELARNQLVFLLSLGQLGLQGYASVLLLKEAAGGFFQA